MKTGAYVWPINEDFGFCFLRENDVIEVDVDGCIMLPARKGIKGTITIETMSGPPGQKKRHRNYISGEHGWTDYADEYGFVLVPMDTDDQREVVRMINTKLKGDKP